MGTRELPIIFIHRGVSDYLRYTLDCARLFNPHKRVILLGDESSRFLQRLGIEHFQLKDYDYGPELALFDRVFQFVAGSDETRRDWIHFVFRRWFILNNFARSHRIERFWTFDSDTLILTDLTPQEPKFAEYDCTTQCNGICMNGYVGNLEIVKKYLDKINEIFQRNEVLDKAREEFKSQPKFAFGEMAAFNIFSKECDFKSMRLNTIINHETFDDCICQAHDMEMNEGGTKTIYLGDGHCYFKHMPADRLVRANTLNMSWVHTYWIADLFFLSLQYFNPGTQAPGLVVYKITRN